MQYIIHTDILQARPTEERKTDRCSYYVDGCCGLCNTKCACVNNVTLRNTRDTQFKLAILYKLYILTSYFPLGCCK